MADEGNEDSGREDDEGMGEESAGDGMEDEEMEGDQEMGSDQEMDGDGEVDELIQEDEEEVEEKMPEPEPAIQRPGKHRFCASCICRVSTHTKMSIHEAKAEASAKEKS